ncbi:MAG TPA: amidase [Stellaceae bacterium]|nr:amidase [Stellaceae bacterium]
MPDDVSSPATDLAFMTIAEAAQRIEKKELSPVELTQALIGRAEALDRQLDAYLLPVFDRALDRARAAEQEIAAGRYRGKLHGIPFALKDIYATAGIRTTGHSRVCLDTVPAADATTVRRLYDAGAILTGKLATHEFAHGGPSFDLPWPPARNPWNRDHFTGGSSSGSGAAIAAGFVPAALGSDTGGSIRGPAALCGIVGLKPTYGLVSRHGVYANSYSFDHAGPMSWTVEDCAIVLQAIAGHDPLDPASADHPLPDYRAALSGDIRGLRIGIVRHLHESDCPVTAEVKAALEAAFDVLRGLGAELGEVRLRPAQDYYDVKVTIAESELLAVHEHALRTSAQDFGEDFLGRVLPAVLIGARDYVQAQRERRRMLTEMTPVYDQFDVLVTATAGGPAPRLDAWRTIEFWRRPSLTTPFNVTGGPALAQCIGFSGSGLPLSMQIVGRPFDEATVLRVAHAYEMATPWRRRRPVLDPAATIPAGSPPIPDPPVAEIDAATRDRAAIACRAAGLFLTDRQFAMVCAAAPHVEAMTGRLYRERSWSEEPANIFRFGD